MTEVVPSFVELSPDRRAEAVARFDLLRPIVEGGVDRDPTRGRTSSRVTSRHLPVVIPRRRKAIKKPDYW